MGKSMKKNKNYKMLAIGLLTLAVVSAAVPAHAQYSLLYNFGVSSVADASGPLGAIAQGEDGSLYSTGLLGGARNLGAVWKITPSGKETVVYSFCSLTCADGDLPNTGLTLRPDGHFLGTTASSDPSGSLPGTIYDVSQTGSFSMLYPPMNGTALGISPVLGPDGSFYGITSGGSNGCGTVYRLSAVFTVIHTFDKTHGCEPSTLVLGTDRSFYGTTSSGGTSNSGVVFKLTYRPGLATLFSVITNVSSTNGAPVGSLVEGSDGNFYGVTTRTPSSGVNGSVFQVTPNGVLTTLHALNGTTDGGLPTALTFASDGNLYGTAVLGGAEGGGGVGTLFQVTLAGTYTVLYRFTGPNSGASPFALVQHTNGLLYGSANVGGAFSGSSYHCDLNPNDGCGVVFSWNGNLPAFGSTVQLMGAVGSEVEILGQGFTSSSIVSFNGVPATATVQSGTSLHATVPVGATTGSITVTTSTGTLTSNRQFVVLP
jgi:uncharacterized repeat protein (TIGR03803 family)